MSKPKTPLMTRLKRSWWKAPRELFLWCNILLMMFPLYFMIVSSMKSNTEFYQDPLGLPQNLWENLKENMTMALTGKVGVLQHTPFLTMLLNTAVLTIVSLAVMVFVASLAGYAMGTRRFKGKTLFTLFVLVIQTVPFFGYIMPMYMFVDELGMTNHLLGVVPVYVAVSLPQCIILMLLTAEGDYVEYSFDLADDVTTASLKLLMQGCSVEVKPQGGSYTTLAADNGSGFWRGAAIYTLDSTNALSGADKKFTVRISYASDPSILNGLLVQTRLDAVDSAYTMAAIGQTYLRNLYDVSAGVKRYFDNGETDNSTPALWFTADGQYVTLRYFDFHADYDCVNIGEHTTPEMLREMLDTVKPDFIQCDCKGHPGLSSYPTKVGTPAPGFARDNLRLWREVTAERGIPLFLHYSGVFDMAAVRKNPQWAIVDEKGVTSRDYTSLKGAYVEELMIPQLCELAEEYDIDGVWIDGEAWAVKKDYSETFLAAFHRDTGCTTAPKTPQDPEYEAYINYLRDSFRKYLCRYTSQVHKKHPDFQMASNWAYSTYMPEKPEAQVDFISADYNPIDSYNTARFESRYMANQGKPWDIMGWSFIISDVECIPTTKTACQISREAAVPISLGGGFQVYVQQKRDGSLENWMLPIVGQVSEFCSQRKEYCFQGENIPQVAVFLSGYNYYKTARRPLHPDKEYLALRGVMQALLDSQLSVQLISEHHLQENLMRYPVLVLPETGYLEEATVQMLRQYMAWGGHLITVGPLASQYFAGEAGVRLERPFTEAERGILANCQCVEELNQAAPELQVDTKRYLSYGGWFTGLDSLSAPVTALADTQVVGLLYGGNGADGPSAPAATCRRVGKGSCTAVWVNIGEKYLLAQRFLIRDFLGDLVKKQFVPMVRVTGSHLVDVNLSRKGNRLLVHLINTSGSHGSEHTYVYDEITPLRNLEMEIDCPVCPANVRAVPEGALTWRWQDGTVYAALEELPIYTIIALEEAQ